MNKLENLKKKRFEGFEPISFQNAFKLIGGTEYATSHSTWYGGIADK